MHSYTKSLVVIRVHLGYLKFWKLSPLVLYCVIKGILWQNIWFKK